MSDSLPITYQVVTIGNLGKIREIIISPIGDIGSVNGSGKVNETTNIANDPKPIHGQIVSILSLLLLAVVLNWVLKNNYILIFQCFNFKLLFFFFQ